MDLSTESVRSTEPSTATVTESESAPEITFANRAWSLQVRLGAALDPHRLVNLRGGSVVADMSYCYQLAAGSAGLSGYSGPDAECIRVRPISWTTERCADFDALIVRGALDFGADGPTDIQLEHTFRLCDNGDFEEQVELIHHFGRDSHRLTNLRFGFRKKLLDRVNFSWVDSAESKELVAIPFRRRSGQGIDHRMASYSAADLMPDEWTQSSLPDRSAEAWLWVGGGQGLLIAKYSQEHIEFSVADGQFVTSPTEASASESSLQVTHLNSNNDLCLRFGGVGISKGSPEMSAYLGARQRLTFGVTILQAFQGDWVEGYAAYKKLLVNRGHAIPADYRPMVHWNELYNLGWRCGGNAPLQELPQLWQEAELARDAGAEAYYFDPGWDLFEGSSEWDTERLGTAEAFIARLRDEYHLTLSLHLMMHTKSLEENPAIYRRLPSGEIDVWTDQTSYAGGYICAASPAWQQHKTERLLRLAAAGVSFFMFDFLNYGPAVIERYASEYTAAPTCWSTEHGHQVPMTREEHANGIMAVIHAVKTNFPDVVIEAHDRIGGEFLPLYYQHQVGISHDELWGFEFMWDPYADLLSGKALSLYEYNLAYDIPLYLHINSAHDSPNMLAFWWYASCCRHLGIGGLERTSPQWERLCDAMRSYNVLREFFTRGDFVGFDLTTHGHMLADRDSMVIAVFNLTSAAVERTLVVDLKSIGMTAFRAVSGATARVDGNRVELAFTVPSLSPHIIHINAAE